MTQVTVNGKTYSDDGSTPNDMLAGKFRDNFLPLIGDTMTDTAAKVAAAANQAAIATNQANVAIGAAASTVTGPGSTGTSTTSLTVGLGTKSLTIQTGKTLYLGMPIVIAASASPQDAMYGPLISYNSATGAMVVEVKNIGTTTAGTYITASAWTVSLSGPAGVTGVLNEFKAAPIATAATVNLDAATGNLVHLTGNATVTGITLSAGAERTCVLDGAPILTNGVNLICPSSANIQGATGDTFVVRGEGGGVARIISYDRASGDPLVLPGLSRPIAVLTPAAAANLDALNVFTSAYDNYLIVINGIKPSAGTDTLAYRLANGGSVDAADNYFQGNFGGGAGGAGGMQRISGNIPAAEGGVSGRIEFFNAQSGGEKLGIVISGGAKSLGTQVILATTGYTGAAISGIRFFWTGGATFAPTGKIRIYGYNNG